MCCRERRPRSRGVKERDRVLRRLRATEDDDVAAAYEADLKVAQAAVRAAEARRASLLAEREAWRVAQARRQKVLDEAADLAQEIDELDFAGQRSVLQRLGAEVQLYREEDADPRWTITTGFIVGSQVVASQQSAADAQSLRDRRAADHRVRRRACRGDGRGRRH